MRCTYKYEFPNFDYDIPQLPEGFVDISWHNDVCPSFSRDLNETQEMVVWVNYADEDRRECERAIALAEEMLGVSRIEDCLNHLSEADAAMERLRRRI